MLLGLFGWTAFWLLGLRRLDWVRQDEGWMALTLAAICAPLISIALMLVSIASMMGVSITALDWPMIEAMIRSTDLGIAFLIRMVLLVVGMCALLASRYNKAGWPIAAGCFAVALITLGWSGHAAATEGAIGILHRLTNGVHLLAAGLWLGAICWFLVLTVKSHRRLGCMPAEPLLRTMHGFAPLGIGLVATVSLTGLINAQLTFGLQKTGHVLNTPYGLLLAAKVILVGAMLALGAHNSRIVRRGAINDFRRSVEPSVSLSNLRKNLVSELALGVGVIGLIAVIGTLSPLPM